MHEMTSAYAVIFISQLRKDADIDAYRAEAGRMAALARRQPGFIGMQSWRDETGRGVTISWWESEAAIAAWRAHPQHAAAMRRGREEWYEHCQIQVCRIERARRVSG